MQFKRSIGGIVLTSSLLWLTACNGTTESVNGPQHTHEQSPTEQPMITKQPSATPTDPPQATEQPTSSEPPEDLEGVPPLVTEAATTVMRALSRKDMNQLAAWVHPEKGLQFSPYGYIDPKKDLVFTRAEVEGLMEDGTKRVWRAFPGSGELIEMTFADYYDRFVYDADFLEDAEIAVNKGLGQGTMINNLNQVYPEDQYDFVEYHIAGIDPSVEGMDWRSLRLVFEKIGEDRALVGIIHDQWTP